MRYEEFKLVSEEIGPFPVVQRMFSRLGLEAMLATYVPEKRLGRRSKLSASKTIAALICNVIVSREPLYGIRSWMRGRAVEFVGLSQDEAELLSDDRIAKALDRLYEIDPASFVTEIVTTTVREFGIDLEQIHNDTTTVTFSGEYEGQKAAEQHPRPPTITFGHNKDHRPDLKQLVYSLTISADGAVPVHYKTYDGNTTDDKTHIRTWNSIRELRGDAQFLYVADSKLCTKENMAYIRDAKGRFLTVLPRSRREDDDFRDALRDGPVVWDEVRRERNARNAEKPDAVYLAHEPGRRSAEGFRIVWYQSSIKADLDQKKRLRQIKRARNRIEELERRTGSHRFRSVDAAEQAAACVLQEECATRWLKVTIGEECVHDFKQASRGRPSKNTMYRRVDHGVILFEVEERAQVIQDEAKCDGLFAMVTNDEDMTPKDMLDTYKYQPFLEKRNEQLKSVLAIAPVWLKKPERVAAMLFVYFIAILILALIEREVRQGMVRNNIESLPLYPEARVCKAPTTEFILRAFDGLRRNHLCDSHGNRVRTFHDPLSPVASQVADLLGVDKAAFGNR